MKQETRYNLIFVVVLLAISLPGIITLVKKKLSQPPRASRGALAAPVRTEVVYVDPLPQSPRLQQVIPPLTRQWVAEQSPLVASLDENTVLNSQRRAFEVIGMETDNGRLHLTLLLWDPRLPQSSDRLTLTLLTPSGALPGAIQAMHPLPLPEPVLEELRNNGYLTPPQHVWRVQVSFPGDATDGELRLQALGSSGPTEDKLDLAVAARQTGR